MIISAFFVFFVTFFQVPRSNKTAAICCQDPDMAQFFPITNLTKSNLMARTNFELRSILSLRGPYAPAIVNRVQETMVQGRSKIYRNRGWLWGSLVPPKESLPLIFFRQKSHSSFIFSSEKYLSIFFRQKRPCPIIIPRQKLFSSSFTSKKFLSPHILSKKLCPIIFFRWKSLSPIFFFFSKVCVVPYNKHTIFTKTPPQTWYDILDLE